MRIMTSFCLSTFILCFTSYSAEKDNTVFIDNGTIRLGVNMSAGGAIFHLGPSNTKQNLLNHYDRGRFIQQSYYGLEDGSKWNDKPWRWNPVQGGHYLGKGAKVIKLKEDKNFIYVKSTPVHWATGEDLTDCIMEQWIELKDNLVSVRYKFTYKGKNKHPARHQEMPAVFVDAAFPNLVYYEGNNPWNNDKLTKIIPTWPNQIKSINENWAAYVNEKEWGLGVYTPKVDKMTCYRHIPLKTNGPKSANCSYFSPILTFPIKSNKSVDYTTYFTLGNIKEIRSRFYKIQKLSNPQKN